MFTLLLTSCTDKKMLKNSKYEMTNTSIKNNYLYSDTAVFNLIVVNYSEMEQQLVTIEHSTIYLEFRNYSFNGNYTIKLIDTSIPILEVRRSSNALFEFKTWYGGAGDEYEVKFENGKLNIYERSVDEGNPEEIARNYAEGKQSKEKEFALTKSLELEKIKFMHLKDIISYSN
jgi:hypothetical protein